MFRNILHYYIIFYLWIGFAGFVSANESFDLETSASQEGKNIVFSFNTKDFSKVDLVKYKNNLYIKLPKKYNLSGLEINPDKIPYVQFVDIGADGKSILVSLINAKFEIEHFKEESVVGFRISPAKTRKVKAKKTNKSNKTSPLLVTTSENSVKFLWESPINAVSFKTGKFIWLIFDRKHSFNLRQVKSDLSNHIDRLVIIPNPKFAIIRFQTKQEIDYSISNNRAGEWSLYFSPHSNNIGEESKPIPIQNNHYKGDLSNIKNVEIHAKVNGDPLKMISPNFGNTWIIIPTTSNSYVENMHIYPDYNLLPTKQGILLQIKSDDVSVDVMEDNITIIGPTQSRYTKNPDS